MNRDIKKEQARPNFFFSLFSTRGDSRGCTLLKKQKGHEHKAGARAVQASRDDDEEGQQRPARRQPTVNYSDSRSVQRIQMVHVSHLFFSFSLGLFPEHVLGEVEMEGCR